MFPRKLFVKSTKTTSPRETASSPAPAAPNIVERVTIRTNDNEWFPMTRTGSDHRQNREITEISTEVGHDVVQDARADDEGDWMHIPRYNLNELSVGELLGRGGFCDVYEVSFVQQQQHEGTPSLDSSSIIATNKGIMDHEVSSSIDTCRVTPASHHQYAIKHLAASRMSCQKDFVIAATDLACEARILAKLHHPNIVKLRGLPSSDLEGLGTGECTGYYLILDKLSYTLEDAFHSMEGDFGVKRSIQLRRLTLRHQQHSDQWIYRMKVARDVARAMSYLHRRNVVYRDLKPSNIGFDANGLVQLFDFGLAKELDGDANEGSDQEYLMTGLAGSFRYMAPEVRLSKRYNLSCDIYSFSILLWQIMSLEKPFGKMTYKTHTENVVVRGRRPKIDSSWRLPIQQLLKDGWNEDLHQRPHMTQVLGVIESELSYSSTITTRVEQKPMSLHGRRISLMPSVFSGTRSTGTSRWFGKSEPPPPEQTKRPRSNTM
mmetsp:Transcript_25436/g.55044  ORF Transcript_25436/g.55044 Transcript_25436/m.55044 type:complete len:489 (+) Transcript_25436:246-1712(+)